MGRTDSGSELALEAVLAELHSLRQRLDQLEQRLALLEGGEVAEVAAPPLVASPMSESTGEGFADWLGRGALLQKLAALCFILVFALLLRTVTDSGYVNPGGGMLLGLGYVAVLVGTGFRFYQQQRPLAPIFAGGGFLLLFAIVVENLNRFATLSTASGFFILLVALAGGSFMGLRFSAPRLLAVSVIGVVVSGLAGNFPRVVFPAAAALLLAANLVAIPADRRGLSPSLKWWVTLLALFFWALWGFKVFIANRHGQPLAPLYGDWYLPLLVLFGGFYLAVSAERYFRSVDFSVYDAVLPTLNMLLLFLAGRVMVVSVGDAGVIFGGVAVGLAGVHFLAGWRLSLAGSGCCGAIGGSMVAGAAMLAVGLPQLLGGVAWALPGLALAAYGLARLSGRCDSAVIRVISYFYQFFGFWVGVLGGVLTTPKAGQFTAALAAALGLAFFSLAQYRWCRRNPPSAGSLYSRLDPRDHSAVILLLCGLGGLYFLGTMLLDKAAATLVDPANTMRCGRSLLINFAVLALLLLGSRYRLPELLWVAVALGVVGCLKVFFVDLFKGSGLPLVLSVLSFGLVAAVGSVIMGRWQRQGSGLPRE